MSYGQSYSYNQSTGLGFDTTETSAATSITDISLEEISARFGQAGLPSPPKGMHYMSNGSLMLGDAHMDHTADPLYKDKLRQVSTGQSDYNKTRAKVVSRASQYSDLPIAMRVHPQLWDVRPLKDLDAVKQSVKNLVITNYNEKVFHPEIGSSVTGLLFELADELTALALRSEIKRVIVEYEPRVSNVQVQVLDDPDANSYKVNIYFTVISTDDIEELEFYLERIR